MKFGINQDTSLLEMDLNDETIVLTKREAEELFGNPNGYYTLWVRRTETHLTNDWNNFEGLDWPTMTRGCFHTEHAAIEWALKMLLPGAPFTVRFVPNGEA